MNLTNVQNRFMINGYTCFISDELALLVMIGTTLSHIAMALPGRMNKNILGFKMVQNPKKNECRSVN